MAVCVSFFRLYFTTVLAKKRIRVVDTISVGGAGGKEACRGGRPLKPAAPADRERKRGADINGGAGEKGVGKVGKIARKCSQNKARNKSNSIMKQQ